MPLSLLARLLPYAALFYTLKNLLLLVWSLPMYAHLLVSVSQSVLVSENWGLQTPLSACTVSLCLSSSLKGWDFFIFSSIVVTTGRSSIGATKKSWSQSTRTCQMPWGSTQRWMFSSTLHLCALLMTALLKPWITHRWVRDLEAAQEKKEDLVRRVPVFLKLWWH